jgi:FkbM family methyltransferase
LGLATLVKKWIPRSLDLPLRYARQKITGRLDIELAVLRRIRPNCIRAVDIGTNIGLYSYGLSRFCNKVESFEPIYQCTEMLRAYAEKRGNITVHNVGLSNWAGNTTLYIPFVGSTETQNFGLASINDPGGRRKALQIVVKRLDDYAFADVGIIKVDVEGHEFEVLEGAIETISREKPLLLVEIEQRHLKGRTIEEVFGLIQSLGYSGGYYCDDHYFSLDRFSYEVHQEPFLGDVYSNEYINNFLFTPNEC